MSNNRFIDYYELMQINPGAETPTIRRVYRLLAARYHPDNKETGDLPLFMRLTEAYQTLTDPRRRAEYDAIYEVHRSQPMGVFGLKEFAIGIDGEGNRRMGMLCLLYNRRRSNPESPGCSVLELETTMAFPREHLLFTLWYLKDKNLIAQNETSDFVITAEGVDFVEQRLPDNDILYRLLKAADSGTTRETASPPWPPDAMSGEDAET